MYSADYILNKMLFLFIKDLQGGNENKSIPQNIEKRVPDKQRDRNIPGISKTYRSVYRRLKGFTAISPSNMFKTSALKSKRWCCN